MEKCLFGVGGILLGASLILGIFTFYKINYFRFKCPRVLQKNFPSQQPKSTEDFVWEYLPDRHAEVFNTTTRFNILFLIRKEFSHSTVWDAWLKDAREWSRQYISKRGMAFGSIDVRFTIHHDVNVDLAKLVKTLPDYMLMYTTIANPVECKWGATTKCMHQLLKTAYNKIQPPGYLQLLRKVGRTTSLEREILDSDFFAFVSQDCIPVKRFSQMALYSMANPRSQIFVRSVNYPRSPKHDQWIILSKRHAELLVNNPMIWTDHRYCGWQSNKIKGNLIVAADDEFCPLFALRKLYENPKCVLPVVAAYEQEYNYTRIDGLWLDINDGGVPGRNVEDFMLSFGDEFQRTCVCWWENDACGIGSAKGEPKVYSSVYKQEFETKVLKSGCWFARKYLQNCEAKDGKTEGGESLPLDEYLIQKLKLQSPPKKLKLQSPPKKLKLQSPPKKLKLQSPPKKLELQSPPKKLKLQTKKEGTPRPQNEKSLFRGI